MHTAYDHSETAVKFIKDRAVSSLKYLAYVKAAITGRVRTPAL